MRDWEISRKFTVIFVCVIVVALSVLFCIGKKKEFSEQENRFLSSFPEFTWERLAEGEYTSEIGDYVADHFPFRDFFVGVKTGFEKVIGKKEVNNVYLAEDGYLIEKYKEPENTERIIRTFRNLKEKVEANVYLMLVPTASVIYSEKLPKGAPIKSQVDTMSKIYEESGCIPIQVLDALKLMRNEEKPLFYHTDHHWTTHGAYLAYQEFCAKLGFEPVAGLEEKVVSEDFKGTIYSKVNDYTRKGDQIVIFENPIQQLTVYYTDTGETTDSLYNYEYLGKKDQYSFFLNNIHPLVEITNQAASLDRELVLIKDSYANCMVPFLVNHYKKIYVVDTRYYKESVSELINQNLANTDVLLLYNMNTMDTDLGIGGIY